MENKQEEKSNKSKNWLIGGGILLFLLKKGAFIFGKLFYFFKFSLLLRALRNFPYEFIAVIILLVGIIAFFYLRKKRRKAKSVWDGSAYRNEPTL